MQKLVLMLLAIPAVCLSGNLALARTLTVDINRTDVQLYNPENADLGDYYVLDFSIPARLPNETFMDAFLEVFVDATTDVDTLAGGSVTTLEVFPLKSSLPGDLSPSNLRAASMKRTVRVGESQRVRINIAEHVRYILDHQSENFGLVVGSISGQRLGKFSLRHEVLGQGVVARVTIVFQELGGPESARK